MQPPLRKVSAACVTFNRLDSVRKTVRDFQLQDYKGAKELVILNTCGNQFLKCDHPDIVCINHFPRPKTLGECRNVCIEHCSGDLILNWDDDDTYAPSHISRAVSDLGVRREHVRINGYFDSDGVFGKTGPMHQLMFTKELFNRAGKYPKKDRGEDRVLVAAMRHISTGSVAWRNQHTTTLTYNTGATSPHVSWTCDYDDHSRLPVTERGVIDLSAAAEEASWRRVNIVTNTDNGAGLQRHANILRERFESHGWDVNFAHFKNPGTWRNADLNLHVEVIEPKTLRFAPTNWFMPMPEWYFDKLWDRYLPRVDRILCNTRHAVDLFESRGGAEFLGFESMDMLDRSVAKERKFLHIAGKSVNKNTEHVLGAWKNHDIPYPLTVIGYREDISPDPDHPNINVIRRVSDDELKHLVNSHWFHLCVSKYEGWGHYIHEASSARGVVISHDQPPLNEFHAAYRVPAHKTGTQRLAPMFEPTPDGIAESAFTLMNKTDSELNGMGDAAREAFLLEVEEFGASIASHIGDTWTN